MSENEVKPQGKGLGVAGFVISLVALIFSTIIFGMVTISVGLGGGMGLGYFWMVLCILSVVLSVMGMIKLGKTGGKRGLAITGMIIGVVATIWSLMLLLAINTAANSVDVQDLNKAVEELQNMK
jgi:hypothetical protein